MRCSIPFRLLTLSLTTSVLAPRVQAQAWSLSGNAGTNPAVQFIGTTDAQPIVVKVNGVEVMRFIPGAGTHVQILGPVVVASKTASDALQSTNTGGGHAVHGQSNGCSFPEGCVAGNGVYGENIGGGAGVLGEGGSYGVVGAGGNVGVWGVAPNGGVSGYAWGNAASGVQGESAAGNGVYGFSHASGSSGVYGENFAAGPWTYGVAGRSSSTGIAVLGDNRGAGWAGYFTGKVRIDGMLSKGGGGFIIDHPLDPTNKYLQHSFVESPDMKNLYDGIAALNARGEATVTLPAWFDALNGELRYQLTCIGAFAPVYIAQQVRGKSFRIAGGRAGMQVSWQITGTRRDAFARANRIQVETDKVGDERGRYLHPKAYDQPDSLAISAQALRALRAVEMRRLRVQLSTPVPEARP